MRTRYLLVRQPRQEISFLTLALAIGAVGIALIAYLSMDTAPDRTNYLIHYANPFWERRIEPAFSTFLLFLKILGLSPPAGITLTVTLIWWLYGQAWKQLSTLAWWESAIAFAIFMIGVNNYLLNTAIRNGLAASICVYAATNILLGKRGYWVLLGITPLVHISTLYFVLSVALVSITKRWSRSVLLSVLMIASVLIVLFHDQVYLTALQITGRYGMYGGYYERYLEAVGTDRLRGYTMILFSGMMLVLFSAPDRTVHRLVYFALPILAAYMAFGASAYTRPIAPHLFFAFMAVLNCYAPSLRRLLTPAFWIWSLCFVACLSCLYAFRMWGIL